MPRSLLAFAAILAFTIPDLAQAAKVAPIRVSIYDAKTVKEQSHFDVPSANPEGGFSLAVGDLGKDGIPEIVLGTGVGVEPRVSVRRRDGTEIGSYLAYDKAMKAGISVAVCDLDADGQAEIATIPQRGAGPHLKIFNAEKELVAETFAYAGTYGGGAQLTCGDLDGEPGAELVTLPSVGGGPHLRVWKLKDGALTLWQEWFAFDESDRRGLVGTIDRQILTIASQHASTVHVRRYAVHSPQTLLDAREFETDSRGIASVVFQDEEETPFFTSLSDAKLLDADGNAVATLAASSGAVSAVAADLNADGVTELVAAPSRPMLGEDEGGKSIVVDLSEQRLYAYEKGVLANTFYVSTARAPFSTPVGKHSVLAKVPFVHYAGPGYDLGVVQYNLRFFPHFYIHYAPWHNNFGFPMSHGCVNVNLENIKWTYEWAEQGMPVTVRP